MRKHTRNWKSNGNRVSFLLKRKATLVWRVLKAFHLATINLDMDNQLSFNYSNYLGDIRYGTAAYAYTIDRRTQTFHVGMTYINYGSFDGYDENGSNTCKV